MATAELQRVPQLSTQVSYTRLSTLDTPSTPGLSAGGLGVVGPVDTYAIPTQIVVPLSDYALRFPGWR